MKEISERDNFCEKPLNAYIGKLEEKYLKVLILIGSLAKKKFGKAAQRDKT